MNQTIEIIVSPEGKTQLETRGFTGSSCRQASRFLEQALGTSINEVFTTDYYTTERESSKLHESS